MRGEDLILKLREENRHYIELIDRAINEVLGEFSGTRFYGPMLYALEGGKRIRPLMLLLVTEAVGGDARDALKASAAIELLHTESIIHDDIIDEGEVRRGRKAFHLSYGYNTSLLTADFVFGVILKIAGEYGDSRIPRSISEAALMMCEGEMEEIEVSSSGKRIGWPDYIRIVSNKTASLFRASSLIGAVIGGADERTVDKMGAFGRSLGIAYQIRDDLHDYDSSPLLSRVVVGGSLERVMKDEAKRYADLALGSLSCLEEGEAKDSLIKLVEVIKLTL